MRKILVTAISGNVANGILKILKETQDQIYGCDIYDYPIGMDKVVDYWKSDRALDSCYIDNLLQKCREYHITHLIPVNEHEIKVISRNQVKFVDAGIKVMINKPEIINVFLDKYRTYQFLNSIEGINVPYTCKCGDFIEHGKKYIVKLRVSCGSKFVKIISSNEELKMLGLENDDYVVQEYIEGDEYTVGVFSNGEQLSTIIFKRRLEHGYTSFVELVNDESIVKEAKLIATRIGLQGYINIQLRKCDNKNYIFEVNPRISGTVFFRHLLDFRDVLWWLALLDDIKQYNYVCKYQTAIGMRELSEKFVIKI